MNELIVFYIGPEKTSGVDVYHYLPRSFVDDTYITLGLRVVRVPTGSTPLDSLIDMVKEQMGKGVKVDGKLITVDSIDIVVKKYDVQNNMRSDTVVEG